MKTLIVCFGLLLIAGCSRQLPADPAHVAEVDAWHSERIEGLRSDTGWLTLVGLHELKTGVNTVGSSEDAGVRLIVKAPARVGDLEIGELGIIFRAAPDAGVVLDGDERAAPVTKLLLTPDSGEEPTVLACGSLAWSLNWEERNTGPAPLVDGARACSWCSAIRPTARPHTAAGVFW